LTDLLEPEPMGKGMGKGREVAAFDTFFCEGKGP
jgi:hypothetical protein